MDVFNQTTINPLNYKQVDDIINACRGKVLYTRFLRQIPHNLKLGALTTPQWMEFVGRIICAYRNNWPESLHFIRVKDIYWSHVFQSMLYRCPFNVEEYPPLPTIECNGDVYVCRRSNIIVGNIFQHDLKSIFEKSDILQRTWKKEDLNVRCGKCQELDRCGGCRGMALAVNGNIMAEDPHCIVADIPKGWPAKVASAMRRIQRLSAASNNVEVTMEEVLWYLKLKGTFSSALRQVTERKLTLKAARETGLKVSSRELQRAVDTFRAGHGLNKATDTQQWLESIGVSVEGLQSFLEANLLIDKFKKKLSRRANEKNGRLSQPLKNFMEEKIYRDWLNHTLQ
jgi:radical SAM protein with 4Fe4S-binding SPASM domain